MKILLILYLFLISLAALALPPESVVTFKGGVFSFYVSHDLSAANRNIEKAIISIHGSERNAHTYYGSIEMLASKFKVADKTILLAPHFKVAGDTLLNKEMMWTHEGWLRGDEASNNKSVSSFALMDFIVSRLSDRILFPNLKEIVLTGHSAGGQFVQRYALGSSLDTLYPETQFRYVVANPGSYLYLTRSRPVLVPLGCAYNNYKYGLDNLNNYMSKTPKSKLILNYISKDVYYFVGENDILSTGIDQICSAQYQGINRLERGRNYKAQLDQEFPSHKHQLMTVPNVGHTQFGMYTSEVGSRILFD